jgi:predicted transcriptional regulator
MQEILPADPDFDDVVDEVVLQSPREWQSLIDHHRGRVGDPFDAGLAQGRHDARASIGDSLRRFHRIALRPYWDQLNAMVGVAAAAWTNLLATRGLEALLNELHPSVRWRQPTLSVDVAGPEVCDPRCFAHHMTDHEDALVKRIPVNRRGLTIMPTVFRSGCGIWGDFDPVRGYSAFCLAVPVPATWQWFETDAPTAGSDVLGELLGLTRSWVLQACVDAEPSTTKLARTVGISISSASEHAAVLRSAGLLESERQGNTVVHRTTPVGQALIQSTRSRIPMIAG